MTSSEFQKELHRLLKLSGVSDLELGHQFGASKPTIRRWLNGYSAPAPAIRLVVLKWLNKRVEEHS